MASSKVCAALAATALLFVAREARAQSNLIDLVSGVYFESVSGLNNRIPGSNISSDFNLDAIFIGGVISSSLVVETAGFPIGSSSGGFTYFFDAKSGMAVRSSPSFGPAFAERPLTSGRGKLNIGMTYLHRSFKEVEGEDLDGGNLKFYSGLFFSATGENADIIESTFRLKFKSDTATFFATYGVMDKLDVSIAVPVQRVSIDAGVSSRLVRTGQALGIPALEVSESDSASGIGDVALRAKYNVFNGDRAAIAAGVDLRLPTGDEENLLGMGKTRTKLYAAFGSKMSKVFPHANIGYTFKSGSADDEDDTFFFGSEVSYTVGAEYVVNPRLTVVGDFVGRSLADEGRLRLQSRTVPLIAITATNAQGVVTSFPAESRTVSDFQFSEGVRLNSTFASIGAKFSPGSTFIVSAHVLFPMTKAGIKSNPTPVIGIDYTF